MSNLKEIRSRITSISSTMKITSAMKMVSAAKLKKAQDRMSNIKPYAEALQETIKNLIPNVNHSEIKLTKQFSEKQKILIVAITSNRGLCGGFNANILKKAKELKNADIEVLSIGKKSADLFSRHQYRVIKKENDILDDPSRLLSQKISQEIIDEFLAGKWSKVILVYNKFKNAATQIVESTPILPITINNMDDDDNKTAQDYIFEPDKTSIINTLIPNQIHTQLFEAILNSIAAEHGARMTAMHKATDNANDLKQNLTLAYNRQRQAAITNEILEIVAGAEALKS